MLKWQRTSRLLKFQYKRLVPTFFRRSFRAPYKGGRPNKHDPLALKFSPIVLQEPRLTPHHSSVRVDLSSSTVNTLVGGTIGHRAPQSGKFPELVPIHSIIKLLQLATKSSLAFYRSFLESQNYEIDLRFDWIRYIPLHACAQFFHLLRPNF